MLIRAGKYHYRRRIPAALVELFGRKEVTKSLHTTDARQATRLKNQLDGQLESLFQACRFSSLSQEVAQAQLRSILEGGTIQPTDNDQPKTIVVAAPSRRRGKRLAEAIEVYCKEHNNRWTSKTQREFSGIFDRMIKSLNNPWLQDLDRPTLVEYRDLLSSEGRSVKTVNKYLQILSTVLRHANRLKWIQGNPAEGLGLQDSRRPDEIRRAFTIDEIKEVFSALQRDKQSFYEKKHPERYWLPLLGIYSGARVNELAQLETEDVIVEDGIPSITITSAGGDGKRIKSDTSRRTIPIHQDLLTLGFLVYVNHVKQEEHGRLFPSLRLGPNGYAHYFVSQHFSGSKGWVKSQLKDLESGVSFHSFRHTFATLLKDAEVEERLIEELMGHRLTSLNLGRYGKPYKADVRIKAINKIEYGLIPEIEEEEIYDPECGQENDYLTCGETRIRVNLERGIV